MDWEVPRFRLEALHCRKSVPLGLWTQSRSLELSQEFWIFPRLWKHRYGILIAGISFCLDSGELSEELYRSRQGPDTPSPALLNPSLCTFFFFNLFFYPCSFCWSSDLAMKYSTPTPKVPPGTLPVFLPHSVCFKFDPTRHTLLKGALLSNE